MLELRLVGWRDGWQGWVGVAPPRCQAICRRAESSLSTPGARSLIFIHIPEGYRAISRWLRSNATTPPVKRLTCSDPGKGRSRRERLRAERPLLAPLSGVLSSVESPVPGVFVAPLLDPALMAPDPSGILKQPHGWPPGRGRH